MIPGPDNAQRTTDNEPAIRDSSAHYTHMTHNTAKTTVFEAGTAKHYRHIPLFDQSIAAISLLLPRIYSRLPLALEPLG